MTKIEDHIKNSIKDTIGYSEASNKESFIIGAQVAFRKAEEYFFNSLKVLNDQRDMYKKAYENTKKDMDTIVSIFKKYDV